MSYYTIQIGDNQVTDHDLTVLGRARIEYGCDEYGRGDDEPGSITLTLRSRHHPTSDAWPTPPITWLDALLSIRQHWDLTNPDTLIVTAAIRSIDAEHDGENWYYTIVADDAVGVASRLKIGDDPWPSEPINSRVARIRAAMPTRFASLIPTIETSSPATIKGRDADATSPLDLLAEAVHGLGYRIRHGEKFDLSIEPDAAIIDHHSRTAPIHRDGSSYAAPIRPDQIEAVTAATLDNGAQLGRIEISYSTPTGDATSRILTSPRGAASLSVATAVVEAPTSNDSASATWAVRRWATRLLTESMTAWRPGPQRIVTAAWSPAPLLELLFRHRTRCTITLAGEQHRLTRAVITLTPTPGQPLSAEITLSPSQLAGIRPGLLADFIPPPGSSPPLTFASFSASYINIATYDTTQAI